MPASLLAAAVLVTNVPGLEWGTPLHRVSRNMLLHQVVAWRSVWYDSCSVLVTDMPGLEWGTPLHRVSRTYVDVVTSGCYMQVYLDVGCSVLVTDVPGLEWGTPLHRVSGQCYFVVTSSCYMQVCLLQHAGHRRP
jgi:hypothetical protein